MLVQQRRLRLNQDKMDPGLWDEFAVSVVMLVAGGESSRPRENKF